MALLKLLVVLATLYIAVIFLFRQHPQACGGIAANLPQFQCKPGFVCREKGNYPDASGICVFRLDFFQ